MAHFHRGAQGGRGHTPCRLPPAGLERWLVSASAPQLPSPLLSRPEPTASPSTALLRFTLALTTDVCVCCRRRRHRRPVHMRCCDAERRCRSPKASTSKRSPRRAARRSGRRWGPTRGSISAPPCRLPCRARLTARHARPSASVGPPVLTARRLPAALAPPRARQSARRRVCGVRRSPARNSARWATYVRSPSEALEIWSRRSRSRRASLHIPQSNLVRNLRGHPTTTLLTESLVCAANATSVNYQALTGLCLQPVHRC